METTTELAQPNSIADAMASRDPEQIAFCKLASAIVLCEGHHSSEPHRDLLATALALYRLAIIHTTAAKIMKETSSIKEVPLAIAAAHAISGQELRRTEGQLANLTEALFGPTGHTASTQ